jgi:Na+/proline symporter
MLYLYAAHYQLDLKGDDLFPTLAMKYFPPVMGLVFIIALISALFPSADGAITALTASFSLDIVGIRRNKNLSEDQQVSIRRNIHLCFALVFLICVMAFHWLNNRSIIDLILKLAGYTYGPLLGLYSFGVLTKSKVREAAVPFVCVTAPLVTWVLADNAPLLFNGFKFGYELLLVNGILTFAGLYIFRKPSAQQAV